MNNFILPDGNVQISFSGGRTSAYMLNRIIEANNGLPDRAVVTFANTGREMQQTLDFVNECSERWGVPIAWLEYDRPNGKAGYRLTDYENASFYGEPFELMIRQKKYLPNIAARFCTTELKILPMKRYLTKQLGWKRWVAAVGIRADEAHREKSESKDRWLYWFPMIQAGITKSDVAEFWQKQAFDLQLPNVKGASPYGNCDFCFLKSESILAAMAREHPDRANWWIRQEKMIDSTFRKGRNLAEFVDFVQRQQDWVFDEQGYFCQASHGECVI
jgi:3'-phosphoadenosine 5'-phosphosulfate sulfotransferase (PAPS reductase)/FAD synthetase